MKKLLTIAMVATVMIVPSMVGITYAGLICPPNITSFVGDVTVDGLCTIGGSAGDIVTGNVKLDTDGDQVNFNAGTLNGDIKCTDSSTGAIFAVAVGSGTTMVGDVKATDCDPVLFGATTVTGNVKVEGGDLDLLSFTGAGATINGNVKVENGDLDIGGGMTINGDVKHLGTGACNIAAGATISGSITGC